MRGRFLALYLAMLALLSSAPFAHAQENSRHVILVLIDGLRWQDLFRGADPDLVNDEAYRTRFVDVPDRAQAFMPFLLSFAQHGALIGDRDHGSCARVTNEYWFSYPGYTEILAGRPNPNINSNAPKPNDDVTALERLNVRPEFAGQVKVWAEWDVVPAIVNETRSGLPVWLAPQNEKTRDPFTVEAVQQMLSDPPRIAFIELGDTDNRAHEGDYLAVLRAGVTADNMLRMIWEAIEANPELAGNTTLIVTTDHGRGDSEHGHWRGHGSGLWRGIHVPRLRKEGSDQTWIAVRGPGVIAAPVYDGEHCATNSQVAATLLESLGLWPEMREDNMGAPLDVFAAPAP